MSSPESVRGPSSAPDRLDALLGGAWFGAYMERYHPRKRGVYVPKPIDPRVAESFLRGLDRGVFPVEDGEVQWPGPTPANWPSCSTPNVYWELSSAKDPMPVSPAREALVTVAAVVDLHLDYGWPKARIRLESPRKGEATRYVLDFMVLDSSDEAIIVGEAKRSRHDLDRIVEDIQACAAMGPHDIEACRTPRSEKLGSHKKYQGLMAFRPPCFWAVAEDHRRSFLVTYSDAALTLHEIDDVPARTTPRRPAQRRRLIKVHTD